jgi:hypothetical protein
MLEPYIPGPLALWLPAVTVTVAVTVPVPVKAFARAASSGGIGRPKLCAPPTGVRLKGKWKSPS